MWFVGFIKRVSVPLEITGLILGNVRDMTTFNACRKVSRAFRSICNKRPLILDDVVLIKLTADCQRTPLDTGNYHADFGALELSTGRKMAVGSSTGEPFRRSYTYRFATGSEYNRKLISEPDTFCLLGLKLPAPFIKSERSWSPAPVRVPIDNSIEPYYWTWPLHQLIQEISASSYLQRLGTAWFKVLKSISTDNNGWSDNVKEADILLLPPSTLHYTLETKFCPGSYFLFLLIKRGSRYWSSLWDDALHEAEQTLNQRVDNTDLAVIIAIGMEIRLFEWRREDGERLDSLMNEPLIGQLIESKPGKKYSIMERDDRMEIEKVIQGAVEKLVKVENENDI
ncbi:MAG: hypothetical protein Q9215_008156 [Flavoplaca cf. flavocitrina]